MTEGGRGGGLAIGADEVPFGAGGAGARGGPPGLLLLLFAFDSGSESYIFTPPALFRNFGMPPAKRPPSCGADSIEEGSGLLG